MQTWYGTNQHVQAKSKNDKEKLEPAVPHGQIATVFSGQAKRAAIRQVGGRACRPGMGFEVLQTNNATATACSNATEHGQDSIAIWM